MSENDFGSAKTMPVTGSGCGIRPSKEAMEVEFEVDFSQAKTLLDENQSQTEPSSHPKKEES